MLYRLNLEPTGVGGFLAQARAVPEAATEGATREEAIANAGDALAVALLGRMADGEDVPAPDSAGDLTEYAAEIEPGAAAKLAFYIAFKSSGLRQAELARRLGKNEAEVRRLLDPHHVSKISSLGAAIKAMGRRLSVELV